MKNISTEERYVWSADLGNGKYQNPILFTDYADPDVIRVGEDFYMIASSFNSSPGIPVLHSKDLVNWTLINHVFDQLPDEYYDTVRPAEGAWAPSIRYHDGKFWVFFSAPDHGIFMSNTTDPWGTWSPLHMVKEVKGWIDPCPFWDEDGQAYLVMGFAKSRCGIKSKLGLSKLKSDGTELLDEPVIVFDGTLNHPTIEGPKLYKREGYYYIFAPAGGVKTGWQTVLRSKNIYGPYEDKIVMHQGQSSINGPHQGGYVELESGESWFLHFQDRGAYGRITHLQPMEWVENWPVMGHNQNEAGIGEPVMEWKKPDVGQSYPISVPVVSDNFDDPKLKLQWQWLANEKEGWYSLSDNPGYLRLSAVNTRKGPETRLYDVPNVLCQKISAPVYSITAKLKLVSDDILDCAGVIVTGSEYASITLSARTDGQKGYRVSLLQGEGSNDFRDERETDDAMMDATDPFVYLMVSIQDNALCTFSYSLDNVHFIQIGKDFQATPDSWVGAKIGIYCINKSYESSVGYADFDWVKLNNYAIS